MNPNSPPTPAAERRRQSREARDAFPPMGVYAVRDRASGRLRIGASRNVHASLNRVQFELRMGCHADRALQASWQADPAAVSFDVLELVKQRTDPAFDYAEELRLMERMWREELTPGATP